MMTIDTVGYVPAVKYSYRTPQFKILKFLTEGDDSVHESGRMLKAQYNTLIAF